MAVHRKRFRVEDIAGGSEMPNFDVTEEAIPMHSEIMAELRAIRAQMAKMKQSELKARKVTVHEERYALVLLLAFLLIVLEALLPEAWLPRREAT